MRGHSAEPTSEDDMVTERVIAASLRDPAAFAPVYDAWHDRVFAYCLRRLGDREAAEDATSRIFLKALSRLAQFHARDGAATVTFRAWLFRIAHNDLIDAGRRTRPHEPLADHIAFLPDASPLPAEIVESREAADALYTALERLPERQRAIIELRLAGLTGVEIAAALGMGENAMRQAQFRATSTLRTALGPMLKEVAS